MEQADVSDDAASAAWFVPADAARTVLLALRGEQLDAFDALVRTTEPEALKELGATEHGQAWADVPRHLVPTDYRLATLHGAARMYRVDGGAAHLDGDLFATVVDCLEAGDPTWAEQAARMWLALVLHTGEASTVWPHASALLDRFPEQLTAHPGLLGNIATLASTCGEPIADELWDRVLAHPALGDDAVRRWEVELDWARCHLLLAGGQPSRAMKVIGRARRGFADLGTASAHLRWTDATLELVCGLTWLGRFDDALALVEDSLRRVEPGGELELWLRAAAAYPAAARGEADAVADAQAALQHAATDTSVIELRGVVPARIFAAQREHDAAALRTIMLDAASIESSSPLDPEARMTWRIHALEAATGLGEASEALARQLLAEFDELHATLPFELPTHALRRDRVERALDGDDTAEHEFRARATRLGLTLPELTSTTPPGSADVSAEHVVSLRLFGPFEVQVDGTPVEERAWSGRRQARLLLAMLIVQGGRLHVDVVADLLWGAVDNQSASARIKPLLASIRSVLAAAGDATPARELVTRGGQITLRLHPNDRHDLQDLRDAVMRVRTAPGRSRETALEALTRTTERPIADLGTDRATEQLRADLDAELLELVPVLASAWDGIAAPGDVVDAVRRVVDQVPTDATASGRLMCLLRDRGDDPGASDVYHRLLVALRELGLTPPVAIAQLHAQIIARGDLDSAPSTVSGA